LSTLPEQTSLKIDAVILPFLQKKTLRLICYAGNINLPAGNINLPAGNNLPVRVPH
jgi:hypothetical protein